MKELVDIFKDIATEMEIKYIYGGVDECILKIHTMSKTPATNEKRFPCLVLFTDIPEVRGDDAGIEMKVTIPSLIICTATLQKWDAEERMQKNFKEVLLPKYRELLQQLEYNTDLATLSSDLLQHTKINRMSWGKSALFTENNMGTEFIDAIEIQNLQLSVYKSC